jgi:hypothetical protein
VLLLGPTGQEEVGAWEEEEMEVEGNEDRKAEGVRVWGLRAVATVLCGME